MDTEIAKRGDAIRGSPKNNISVEQCDTDRFVLEFGAQDQGIPTIPYGSAFTRHFSLSLLARSSHHDTAIDVELLTCHEITRVTGKKYAGAGQVHGFLHTMNEAPLATFLQIFPVDASGIGNAWMDHIDANIKEGIDKLKKKDIPFLPII